MRKIVQIATSASATDGAFSHRLYAQLTKGKTWFDAEETI